jgi:hypothetical protein
MKNSKNNNSCEREIQLLPHICRESRFLLYILVIHNWKRKQPTYERWIILLTCETHYRLWSPFEESKPKIFISLLTK